MHAPGNSVHSAMCYLFSNTCDERFQTIFNIHNFCCSSPFPSSTFWTKLKKNIIKQPRFLSLDETLHTVHCVLGQDTLLLQCLTLHPGKLVRCARICTSVLSWTLCADSVAYPSIFNNKASNLCYSSNRLTSLCSNG